MAEDQKTFDDQLTAMVTALTALDAAILAIIEKAKTGGVDLTAEGAQVTAATTDLQTQLAAIQAALNG